MGQVAPIFFVVSLHCRKAATALEAKEQDNNDAFAGMHITYQ
jgi:hypothetical protein